MISRSSLVVLLACLALPAFAEQFEIQRPDVTRPRLVRSDITFQPGDEVTVHAGGCVNVGGGDWRDYVSPAGADSERLYHGRIDIPGATAGMVRIGTVIGRPLHVSMLPRHRAGPLALEIGYEADDYSRASYDGPMRGPCSAPAWIRIERNPQPAAGPPEASPAPVAPLDLSWHAVDENYLPANPDWNYHEKTGRLVNSHTMCGDFANGAWVRSPDCTRWDAEVDEAAFPHVWCGMVFRQIFSGAIRGHANWAAAYFDARAYYETRTLDGDYDFGIDTDEHSVAAGNDLYRSLHRRVIHGEFASQEVTARMRAGCGPDATGWERFRCAIDNRTSPRDVVNGRPAKIIGLLNFDNEHIRSSAGAHTELHPIYLFAVMTHEDAVTQTWSFFARDYGNQGSCSHPGSTHKLYLPGDAMYFHIEGVASLDLPRSRIESTRCCTAPLLSAEPTNDGVLVKVNLPHPGDDLVWGDLVFVKSRQ